MRTCGSGDSGSIRLMRKGELQALSSHIHYNPVKHGLSPCVHAWAPSSFSRWVARGLYDRSWGCCCGREQQAPRNLASLKGVVAEP